VRVCWCCRMGRYFVFRVEVCGSGVTTTLHRDHPTRHSRARSPASADSSPPRPPRTPQQRHENPLKGRGGTPPPRHRTTNRAPPRGSHMQRTPKPLPGRPEGKGQALTHGRESGGGSARTLPPSPLSAPSRPRGPSKACTVGGPRNTLEHPNHPPPPTVPQLSKPPPTATAIWAAAK